MHVYTSMCVYTHMYDYVGIRSVSQHYMYLCQYTLAYVCVECMFICVFKHTNDKHICILIPI